MHKEGLSAIAAIHTAHRTQKVVALAESVFRDYVAQNADSYTHQLEQLGDQELRILVTTLLDFTILPIMEGERPFLTGEGGK